MRGLTPTHESGTQTSICLFVDLEGEVELFAVIEGADVFCAALLAATLGPNLVVRVLGELAEAVAAVVGGDVTLHGERVAVLEIHGGAFQAGPGFIDNLALNGPCGIGVLREGAGWGTQCYETRKSKQQSEDSAISAAAKRQAEPVGFHRKIVRFSGAAAERGYSSSSSMVGGSSSSS
jgi:hypothetical protein